LRGCAAHDGERSSLEYCTVTTNHAGDHLGRKTLGVEQNADSSPSVRSLLTHGALTNANGRDAGRNECLRENGALRAGGDAARALAIEEAARPLLEVTARPEICLATLSRPHLKLHAEAESSNRSEYPLKTTWLSERPSETP